MKYILFLIFVITPFSMVFSQSNKSPVGVVLYGHKQSLGLGGPYGIDYNAALTFNTKESSYIYRKDSLEGGHVNELIRSENKDMMTVSNKVTNEKGFIFFIQRDKNIAESRDIGFMHVKETVPKIDWKITSETKTIGNFKCTKAKGDFRGRNYTAWFTPAIPLPFGPWKLQGLPGLILEAYDTNKEVYFYFKSLKYPYKEVAYITRPNPELENKKWITLDEYKEAVIGAYKKGIENFRLLTEQNSDNILGTEEVPMRNAYVEVFDH